MDWHKCRFLESSENLKPLVRMRFGREPSTSIAREIAACLQQGRILYEAAAVSPLEVRPLQLFYGMVGFAKALVVANRLKPLSSLVPAHGLKDISTHNSRIEQLRVKILKSGTFQEFNDVVAQFNRVLCVDSSSQIQKWSMPSADSGSLSGVELSLKEILSRVPGLNSLYRMTFNESPNAESTGLVRGFQDDTAFQLTFSDPRAVTDRDSLKLIVQSIRKRFPFLIEWQLESARYSWGESIIGFTNLPKGGLDDLSEDFMVQDGAAFDAAVRENQESLRFSIADGMRSVASYPGMGLFAISPVRNFDVSEFSLHYLALFVLSSLVRYRPQVWSHAISRSAMSEAPTDDKALSLIERFLDVNFSSIPSMVVAALNPNDDPFR